MTSGTVPTLDDGGRLDALLADNADAWELERWGFDTIVLRFKIRSAEAQECLAAPFHPGDADGALAELDWDRGTFDPETGDPAAVTVRPSKNWTLLLDYATVSGFPETNLVNVETRVRKLLSRDASDRGLGSPEELLLAAAQCSELVTKVLGGNPHGAEPILRRADLATDLRSPSSAAPKLVSDLLTALSRTHLARHAPTPHPAPDRGLEGVDWRTGTNRVVYRVYDKPLEMSKSKHRVSANDPDDPNRKVPHEMAGPAGHVVRFERQWSPSSNKDYRRPTDFVTEDLAAHFLGPWRGWLSKSADLVMCGHEAAGREIADLVRAGKLTAPRARGLLGTLDALNREDWHLLGADSAAAGKTKGERALRQVGVLFAREMPPHARARVGAAFDAAAEPWRTAALDPPSSPPEGDDGWQELWKQLELDESLDDPEFDGKVDPTS